MGKRACFLDIVANFSELLNMHTRREFLKQASLSGTALFSLNLFPPSGEQNEKAGKTMLPEISSSPGSIPTLDLSPAQWIWYPSERTLPNTFVLFRKTLALETKPHRAVGWLTADSRYLLCVNGRRVQQGPAPSDPRILDVDPMDLTALLHSGENVIGVTALHFGLGDGTSPIGKPGFIFLLHVEFADESSHTICSDSSWLSHIAQAWKPGQYKRWYLRSLQEVFDARRYPYGWDAAPYDAKDWLPSMTIGCPANKSPICSTYTDYLMEMRGDPATSALRARTIPFMREEEIPALALRQLHQITWKRPAEEYFDVVTPSAYEAQAAPIPALVHPGEWEIALEPDHSRALTFEFSEEIVGFPYFTIEAPEGTIVELLVHEAHAPDGPPILNTHFHSWARFICRAGINRFETFEYEACKWLQLVVRGTPGPIRISNVGVRRRTFPWPTPARCSCSDKTIQKLIHASLNTLNNSAQETIVDGMGRERQQYSGDGAHQLHGVYLAYGEKRLPARYITTFGQGITLDGFFMDCWPAYDRLARVMERQLGLTPWGPLLDHGVGFVFDCYHHALYTGDMETLRGVYPNLQRFVEYLQTIRGESGLLKVNGIGLPAVWIDHDAYLPQHQHHKQCAFNLYASAMLQYAFAPLSRALGANDWAVRTERWGKDIERSTVSAFWDPDSRIFIINRPWLEQEKNPRLCDRSLATAVLYDQCPGGDTGPSIQALAELPPNMGFSYPANAGWRLWALSKAGRTDVVLHDLRTRWNAMASVHLNNSLQEFWKALPDAGDLWSHCPIAPLYILYMGIAGIQPIEPGFATIRIRPQLADLEHLDLTVPTPKGELRFLSDGKVGGRTLTLTIPEHSAGELVLDARESPGRPPMNVTLFPGTRSYRLEPGTTLSIPLKYT
jgi:alpha-L-rhamnosidase